MPKIYIGNEGDFYFVDSWENVFTVTAIVTREELDTYRGDRFLLREKTNTLIRQAIETGRMTDDFFTIGYKDEDIDIGIKGTVILAKLGHHRYIPANRGIE